MPEPEPIVSGSGESATVAVFAAFAPGGPAASKSACERADDWGQAFLCKGGWLFERAES